MGITLLYFFINPTWFWTRIPKLTKTKVFATEMCIKMEELTLVISFYASLVKFHFLLLF